METNPRKIGPPQVIEGVVEWLIPCEYRDETVGDLCERYVSPRQFILDAAEMLRFVVTGQLHRLGESYTATWLMNLLWMTACLTLIVSARGGFLSTFVPLALFGLAYRLQMNGSTGRAPERGGLLHRLRSELTRKRDRLWSGPANVAEALFFVVLAVWTNLTALLALSVLWFFIRKANQKTARALQEKIDALNASEKK